MEDCVRTKSLLEITDKKRLGILRTFHHNLYESPDTNPQNRIKSCCSFYCWHNRGACLIIGISLVVITIGILSIIYGSMIPSITQEKKHKVKTLYSRELFLICGVSILGFGLVASFLGFLIPLYTHRYQKLKEEPGNQTPIIVNYELLPYESSNCSTFLYSDSSNPTSNCASPLSDEHFETLYVQKNSS